MAVLAPHVVAAGALTGLLVLLFAVLGFAVVAGVVVVVLALLQAVLPGEDSGAAAVHAEEQRRAEEQRLAEEQRRQAEEPASSAPSGQPAEPGHRG